MKFLFASFFFWFSAIGISQNIRFHSPLGNVSQNTITTITQDSKGFIWFGSRHGLNRYNGVKFTHYFSNSSKHLSNSFIQTLFTDSKGNIWIGTYGGGLSLFDIEKEEFIDIKTLNLPSPLHAKYIITIYEDSRGGIWIGTEKSGLFYWKRNTNQLHHFRAEDDGPGLNSNFITGITENDGKNVLITSWGGGVCRYSFDKGTIRCFTHNELTSLPTDNVIRQLHKSIKGNIWLGTHEGVFKVNQKSDQQPEVNRLSVNNTEFDRLLAQTTVLSILEDSKSRLWIGTENQGLFLYNLNSKLVTHYLQNPNNKYGIKSNSIWSLFEDKHGTIWVGTYKKGVNKIDPFEQKFDHISDGPGTKLNLGYGLVSAFSEDENGHLWIGTDGGGLYHLAGLSSELTIQKFTTTTNPKITSNDVVCLLKDDDENLWIGTWGQGLLIKSKGSSQFKSIKHDPNNPNSPSNNDIYDLYKDKLGHIWISTYRAGVNRYIPESGKYYHYGLGNHARSFSSGKVKTMVTDNSDNLWIGTEDGGIDRIRFNKDYQVTEVKNFSNIEKDGKSLSFNVINYLFVDQYGTLWIGTDGGGLDKFNSDTETFEHYTTANGLSGNVIYGILEDENGLWISTNNGLSYFDPKKESVVKFDESDGLQSNEFNTSACYKTKNGNLLFGGVNGFNYFNPNRIKSNSIVPDLFITDIQLSNSNNEEINNSLRKQLVSKSIKLNADQNDIRLEFAALSYSQAGKNQYKCFLENVDNDWRNLGNSNYVNYFNLPPGQYNFKVLASNNDQVWNMTPAVLTIFISPPWFLSMPAKIFYAFLAGLLLFGIYRALIFRERLKNKLKIEQVELNKMQEISKTRSQFFANISHEFKTPITLIITPLKAMTASLKAEQKEHVQTAIGNAKRLLKLINQILDLSKLDSGMMRLKASEADLVEFTRNIAYNFFSLAENHNIDFNISLPEQSLYVYFENDKLEKVLLNLLSNAFKFTDEFGSVELVLEESDSNATIVIKDSGKGIERDQLNMIFDRYYRTKDNNLSSGTGIGLSLTKQLVELHQGHISVTSKVGKGSTFKVTLPKGKVHLSDNQIVTVQPANNPEEKDEMANFEIPQKKKSTKISNGDLPIILIVEDNSELRSFISDYLSSNYQTLEAENGKEALSLAKNHIPDIIITDLMMPKMDGFMLSEKIRENEKTSHIPIILLTVKSTDESKEMGFQKGITYYLTKPFNPKLLDLRINNILQIREKNRDQKLNLVSAVVENKEVSKTTSKEDEFIQKLLKIVEANMSNSDFHIEDLCREMGFSKSQLYRKLKGVVGLSANEFIRSIRLKKAAQLLKESKLTIAEITYQVGFNDLQYFRNSFKKQYGILPSEFQKQN